MCNFCSVARGPYHLYVIKQPWVVCADFVTVRTLAGEIAGDGLFVDVQAPPEGADAAWIRQVLKEVGEIVVADRLNFSTRAGRLLYPGEKVMEDIKDSFRAEVTMIDAVSAGDLPKRKPVCVVPDKVLLCLHCAREGGFLSDEQVSIGGSRRVDHPGSHSQDSWVEAELSDVPLDYVDELSDVPEDYSEDFKGNGLHQQAEAQTDVTIAPGANLDLLNLEADCVDVGTQTETDGWIKQVVRQRQLGEKGYETEKVDEEVTVAWLVAKTSCAPAGGRAPAPGNWQPERVRPPESDDE